MIPEAAASIRVAVVEDRAEWREGLVTLLGAEPDFLLTGVVRQRFHRSSASR